MTARAWITALLVTLAVGWIAASVDSSHATAAPEITADEEDRAALASRDWAASQICKGQAFEWLDDKTLVCHREVASTKGTL